jgi:pyruvate dehydrogenase E1 component
MIPFYIYYSMFGFQRIGDLAWAAGDMQARGFLMGGTAGRTTLAGEGLQHQDGHSHIMAGTIPNCISYDPTFAYELAVIIHSGLKRMYQQKDNVFYYITVMNENYPHPGMPKGCEDGIVKGLYCLEEGEEKGPKLQLMGSGTILREVIAAADLLKDDFGVNADVWSVTSVNELAREAQDCARWNRLHPTKKARQSFFATQLRGRKGPVVYASDYIRAYGEQLREFVWSRYVTLGTDGFGRSDTRENLRHFFEVSRYYVVVAALKALADDGEVDVKLVQQAIKKYGIDTEKPNPISV